MGPVSESAAEGRDVGCGDSDRTHHHEESADKCRDDEWDRIFCDICQHRPDTSRDGSASEWPSPREMALFSQVPAVSSENCRSADGFAGAFALPAEQEPNSGPGRRDQDWFHFERHACDRSTDIASKGHDPSEQNAIKPPTLEAEQQSDAEDQQAYRGRLAGNPT